MQFPLTTSDISIWLAITALILLATTELVFSRPRTNLIIEKRRLAQGALMLGILFMATVLVWIYRIATSARPPV